MILIDQGIAEIIVFVGEFNGGSLQGSSLGDTVMLCKGAGGNVPDNDFERNDLHLFHDRFTIVDLFDIMGRNAFLLQQAHKGIGHLVIDDALAGDGAFFQTVESSGIIFVGYDQKIGVFSRVDFFGFSFVQHFTFVHCRRPSIPYFPKGIITQCPVYFQYEKSPLRMQRGRG